MTTLAKRDKAIQTMMTELENKRQLLKGKYKSLHNAASDNTLLKDVLEDYLNYYTTIKKEKTSQYNALNKTLEHIESITASDESIVKNIKNDHKEISDEMKRINKEIELLEKNNI
jgi:chromosome segregation ATPase